MAKITGSRFLISLAPLFVCALLLAGTAGCGKATDLTLSGTIEALQLEAAAETAGKVLSLEKQEGDTVKKGDVISVLDSAMQALIVEQQKAVVSLKEARLEDLKAGTRPQQLEQAQAAVKSAEVAVNNAATQVKNAQTTYDYLTTKLDNVEKLNEKAAASDNDVLDATYKKDTAKQQLDIAKKNQQSAEAGLESAQAGLELLRSGSTSQTIKASEADLEQSRLALKQAELVLDKFKVRAPMDGIITMTNVNAGDLVNTGTSVATLSETHDLWMNVFLPQKYLMHVSEGQELALHVNALGDRKVKGTIISIASKAEFTPKNIETDETKENTVFRIKIKMLDNIEQLRPGMTADASIPLDNK